MKKFLSLVLACVMICAMALMVACGDEKTQEEDNGKIIVNTNAYFAPFEYYDGTDIVGVDVDIMAKVGEKLGKQIQFDNTEFAVIIDNVAKGEVCDCGAAGITVTEERAAKVDFSIPYYTSVQYVIWADDDDSVKTENDEYVLWDALAGKKIGVQTDTTGMIYAGDEVDGEEGVLFGSGAELSNFDNAQLAADAVAADQLDVVIIDELPAKYIVEKNSGFKCLPLFYNGADGEEDSPTEEQYAICVTKGDTELLNAINDVLTEMLKTGDDGKTEVESLLMKHMGLN
ncbi:MAG: transporter substrate-binding domain-containing protein [Clostridia bacterium]|nr:transporter substrate-binding domain-containing protein [Clostridia bacterium]